MRRLFAHRDARLLLLGQTLSLFGDRAMFLVLGIWVKSLTGSNAAAGLVFFTFALPALAAPLSGMVVDRVRRRPLMLLTDVAIGLALLALLLVHGRDQLWLIYLVTLLYGLAAVVFGAAQSALLTVLLPEELLGEANAAFQTVSEGMRLLAPLIGAGLYVAVGPGSVAVVDAATFGVSALCLLGLRTPEPAVARQERAFLRELTAGVRHVQRTLPLRQLVLAVGAALLVIGFTETLIFAVVDQGLHRPASFFGVLAACQGVGAVGGGLTAPVGLRRLSDGRLVGSGIALFALGSALLTLGRLPLVLMGMAIGGLGLSWAIVGFVTALQRRTPADLQGRVYSAAMGVVGMPQTLSIALGAALVTVFDYRLLLAAVAAVSATCGLYLMTSRAFGEPAPAVVVAAGS